MRDSLVTRVESLVYGGDALGRMGDGRAVFVPFAIPGELVRFRVVEEKQGYARAELAEVLEASPHRVSARCSHFQTCGGCHYQHMDYPTQLNAKARILHEQLERIGKLKAIPDIEVISAEPWNYRNHVQFHLTPDGRPGYQRAHSNQTFAINECHLPEATISRTWPQLEIEPTKSLQRISLRSGAEIDLMLILESADAEALDFDIEGLEISLVHQCPSSRVVLAGSDHIAMEVSGRQFSVSAGSFFQVNTQLASGMVARLLGDLTLDEKMTVVDGYCGVGLFSAFLAPRVGSLIGIEISPDACADFGDNLDEFDNVSLYEAGVSEVLGNVELHPDAILVDPPREGLGAKTVEAILAQGAGQLEYVSCDPATLARDASRLVAGGYQVQKLALIDMFPQTFHIECISYWVRG